LGNTSSEKLAPIRKGLLELVILKIIAADKMYAADMLKRLSDTEFATQEGTLYPLLSKLRRENPGQAYTENWDPRRLWQGLLDRGVLVRDVSRYPTLERHLRVTIGTPAEDDAFLTALTEELRP